MDQRRMCMACGTSPARYHCTRCNFASFCCHEHQRTSWSVHKMFCKPLDIAVRSTLEKSRPKFQAIEKSNGRCIFCAEDATNKKLFKLGCACSIAVTHLDCFIDSIRNAYSDVTKREDGIYCGCLEKCPKCKNERRGISIRIELALELWKLRDPQDQFLLNVRNFNHIQNLNDLFCTLKALENTITLFANSPNELHLRLRLNYKLLDLIQIMQTNAHGRIMLTTEIYLVLASVHKKFHEFNLAINMLRYTSTQLDTLNETFQVLGHKQNVNCLLASILVAKSEFDVTSDKNGQLKEGEILMRSVVQNNARLYSGAVTTKTLGDRAMLAQIITLQERFNDACDILDACIEDSVRQFGPEHQVTKRFMDLIEADKMKDNGERLHTNFTQIPPPSANN